MNSFHRTCGQYQQFHGDIFNTGDEIFLVFTEKSKFSFYFSVKGKKPKIFIVLVNFAWLSGLMGIILGANYIGCKHSVHLENGLQCHFNDWIKKKFAV